VRFVAAHTAMFILLQANITAKVDGSVSCVRHLVFCVVMTVQCGMELYNDQPNAQGFNLFIYLLLPYMFWAFF
jgi:hypothetical protein